MIWDDRERGSAFQFVILFATILARKKMISFTLDFPHLLATLTTTQTLPLYASNSTSSPSSVRALNSYSDLEREKKLLYVPREIK